MCTLFVLLVLYQIKHFVCDYPLQTPYMLGKFKKYPDFIMPLLTHAAVHGVATFFIALWFKPEIAGFLALFDAGIHFIVDRIKASPSLLGRFKALSGTEYIQLQQNRAASEIVLEYRAKLKPKTRGWRKTIEKNREYHKSQIAGYNKQFKSNVYFWWALGADQMAHHLTHYAIIWFLL